MRTINTSKPVIVCGEMPGFVQYICEDGSMGITLIGEKGRIDEWHPTQVRPATMKEVAEMKVTMLGIK